MPSDSKIRLDRPRLTYEEGKRREWVVANGLGGYASSTAIGLNTRKYHGLLVASLEPPVRRWVLLSKIEEELSIGGKTYQLSTNSYRDAVHPTGYAHQIGFALDAFPTFTYSVEGVTVEKSVLMPRGHNATLISYRIENPGKEVGLRLRPLVTSRDFHSNLHSGSIGWGFQEKAGESQIELTASFEGAPTLLLSCEGSRYRPSAFWVYNMFYEVEDSRGYDPREDLYSPGEFVRECPAGSTTVDIMAAGGAGEEASETIGKLLPLRSGLLEGERERLKAVGKKVFEANSLPYDPSVELLARAADSFIVDRRSPGSKSIIAGYHWFSDWGRDAMISLPGVALATARFEEAKEVLRTFALSTDAGLVPNRFPDSGGAADYNSADASLWFLIAVHRFLERTGDYAFVMGELWGKMREIVGSYIEGTGSHIYMAEDGLISAGDETTQLTWMDAKVGGAPVTPRHGKAVEINALWYNALKIMDKLARRFGEEPEEYQMLAERAKESFNRTFWNAEEECLYDVVSGDRKDGSIRPNQVFAVSLPYPLLDAERSKKVLFKVMEELYTPYGLRSLSPKDPRYQGTCSGDQTRRDRAYHQGTAWSWLMGPFISAYVKVNREDTTARTKAAKFITPLLNHLKDAGLGTVSEVFDGSPPFAPGGCISQAWSVGELLRCIVEDL